MGFSARQSAVANTGNPLVSNLYLGDCFDYAFALIRSTEYIERWDEALRVSIPKVPTATGTQSPKIGSGVSLPNPVAQTHLRRLATAGFF